MRRIRGSFHLALTIGGTLLIAYAVMSVEGMYDRMLVVALGLVLIEAGIWRVTQSLFPNERAYKPLRKETDYFVTLVRRLNKSAVAVQRGAVELGEERSLVRDREDHDVGLDLRRIDPIQEALDAAAGN